MYNEKLLDLVRENDIISNESILIIDNFLNNMSNNGIFNVNELTKNIKQKGIYNEILMFLIDNNIIEIYEYKCYKCDEYTSEEQCPICEKLIDNDYINANYKVVEQDKKQIGIAQLTCEKCGTKYAGWVKRNNTFTSTQPCPICERKHYRKNDEKIVKSQYFLKEEMIKIALCDLKLEPLLIKNITDISSDLVNNVHIITFGKIHEDYEINIPDLDLKEITVTKNFIELALKEKNITLKFSNGNHNYFYTN